MQNLFNNSTFFHLQDRHVFSHNFTFVSLLLDLSHFCFICYDCVYKILNPKTTGTVTPFVLDIFGLVFGVVTLGYDRNVMTTLGLLTNSFPLLPHSFSPLPLLYSSLKGFERVKPHQTHQVPFAYAV